MEEKVRIKYLEALGKYVKEIVGIRKDTRERVDWDNYFLNIATMIATRATCLRRAFGAVIVDPETNSIVSTGYCGNAGKTPNCLDLGKCFREEAKIPSGMLYNLCQSVHAEENAIMAAGKEKCVGKTIYVAGINIDSGEIFMGKPCYKCESRIINAKLESIVYLDKNYNLIKEKLSDKISKRQSKPLEESERELKLLKEKGFKVD